MNTPSTRSLLEFAVNAAWQAGRLTLGYFQTGIAAERKADNTPVTLADRQAEQKLRDLITRQWPDHGIIGEELGTQPGSSGLTWILDPIDGTKSFVHGVPLYANLIALTDAQGPLVGVANFPALGEMIYAARGVGCFWNGRPAHVSTISDIKDATLLTSDMVGFAQLGKAEAWQSLLDSTYIQRTWGDAYGYALVATGRAEVMVDPLTEVWDCGPLQVILEEAGGTFTDWQGTPTIYGREAIATNGHLFAEVMRLVRSQTP